MSTDNVLFDLNELTEIVGLNTTEDLIELSENNGNGIIDEINGIDFNINDVATQKTLEEYVEELFELHASNCAALKEAENHDSNDDTGEVEVHIERNNACLEIFNDVSVDEKDITQPEETEKIKRQDDMPKNFVCDLCPEAFEKKLQLNNHKERRHGVKFVFTEKGKKVKLVRLPKDFEFRAGEKLDPCVQMLIQATQHGGTHEGAIGVQTVEDVQQSRSSFHILDNCNREDILQNDENWESFECGFLVEAIKNEAVEVTKVRKQTPFVAFYPERSVGSYVLRILPINAEQNLLVPASPHDIVTAEGAELERVVYIHDANESGKAGPSREITSKCKRDYKIPIVAIVQQVYDDALQQYVLHVDPPTQDNKVASIEFLGAERFSEYAKQCQGKTVRTLSEAAIPIPPPKPRKPYQRRSLSLPPKKDDGVVPTNEEEVVGSEIPREKVRQSRSRRSFKKELMDPDEEKDPSYEPSMPAKTRITRTVKIENTDSTSSVPTTIVRKRGRPRKVKEDQEPVLPPKASKRQSVTIKNRGAKRPKEMKELIEAVKSILKTEKPSTDEY